MIQIGELVTVIHVSRNIDIKRIETSRISQIRTDSFIELENGRRFDPYTLQEIQSIRCQNPEKSYLRLDEYLYYDHTLPYNR